MELSALQDIIRDYSPRPKVLGELKDISLVALVGPTAVGKTTLIKNLVDRDTKISRVVSETSRDPRGDERLGVDYIFRSQEEMIVNIKKRHYVQALISVYGVIYASQPSNFGDSGIAIMSVQSWVVHTFRSLPFKTVKVICVVPPDYDTWQKRIKSHNFSSQNFAKRMQEARQSLEFSQIDKNSQLLMNDNLGEAVNILSDLVHRRKLNDASLQNQRAAKIAAESILSKLQRIPNV